MKLNKKFYCNSKKIFINGIIYSIDRKSSVYEAMATKDGIIEALGTNDEIIKSCTNDTEIVDLKSRTVLPGFIDAHSHMSERFMIKKDELSLFEANNLKECLNLIQSYIDSHPNDKVVYGIGWRNSIFQSEYLKNSIEIFKGPNKKWLESIITDKPIVLKSCDADTLWLNDKAFKYFKINGQTIIPAGGKIELDEHGEIWGTLKGNAASLVNIGNTRNIKKYSEKEYLISFIKYQNMIHSYGITCISSIDQETIEFPLEVYKRLEIESKLKLRIVYGIAIKPCKVCKKNINEQIHDLKKNKVMYQTELFNVSIAKFFADGVIENMTAYLFKPYKITKESIDEENGIFLWEEEELKSGIKMANMLDFNVYIHAVGDFACKLAIDGIEYSLKNNINNSYRNALVNMDLITKYYIMRMKTLNINAIIKPFWFYKDIGSSKNEVVAIGEERACRQYPVKSLINEGVITAGGSDSDTIENATPLKAIECANLRNLYDFIPSGYPKIVNMADAKYRLNPSERISIIEAIKMFTINAAYVLGKEKEIGSLEVGKKADFIILDKDIFSINPLEIQDININRTYFNGELVYLNE